ncbi:MAG: glycosyltransferase, partial [Gammaproteobacteria bacterium]
MIREAASLANVKSRMRRILMRWLYPLVDQVVVLTDYMSHELQGALGLSGRKISVIGNPIDVDRIRALVEERVESQKTNSWKPYLLSIGRLAEQKDFSTVIKAFALLCRDMDLNLVILGDGPQRQMLEELVADLGLTARVHMPGRVKNPYPWLARASVFVLSSRWEGYPNVLLEAQY